MSANLLASVSVGGPFDFTLMMDNGATLWLRMDGGEWRLDGLWIAQGRIDRWDALARACRKVTGEPA